MSARAEKLELTPKRSVAELPKTKVPAGKRCGQFVEVPGAQRLQEHEPSPAARVAKLPFSDLIVPLAALA